MSTVYTQYSGTAERTFLRLAGFFQSPVVGYGVLCVAVTNKVSPRGRRDDMPPADGSSTMAYRFAANQKSRRIYVRPRSGPQSEHLWWPAVAKLQAASVPIA